MRSLEEIQAMNARAVAKVLPIRAEAPVERPLRTGDEVTTLEGGMRGVVVDGHVNRSGKNKGCIEVMWIGGRYTTAEYPADLKLVEQ